MVMMKDPVSGADVEVVEYSDLKTGRLKRGKVRDVYDLGDELLIYHTDRVSAFDVILPTPIPRKGESLQELSVHWMKKSARIFPNHLVSVENSRVLRVKKAKRVDIEWVIRKYLYGSLWRSYAKGKREMYGIRFPDGLEMAEVLPLPIITPTTKADVGHDEEITRSEAVGRGIVDGETWDRLEEATLKLYGFYEGEAKKRGIIIPDFKIEFGIHEGELIQIDEPPTHDSARMWARNHYRRGEAQEKHCLDKEFLRECLRRLGFSGEGKAPELPAGVVKEVVKRCVGANRVIAQGVSVEELGLKSVDELLPP